MKRLIAYMFLAMLAACQREIHFPRVLSQAPIPEKVITAVIIADPGRNDYDSVTYSYETNRIIETHYSRTAIVSTRIYKYDAAGRLSGIEDDRQVYHTNNDAARSIRFIYNNAGELVQTETDFTSVPGIKASFINIATGNSKQSLVYDTSYLGPGYNLQWINRKIYNTISSGRYLLYDSSINTNTINTALVKTVVAAYSYDSDSTVSAIEKRTYFNGQLSEWGTTRVTADKPAPVYQSLRKKLYRNLSNWFDAGSIWQDDNYDLFPLPGGPYRSILFNGVSADGSPTPIPFIRNYTFKNTYSGDQLDKSEITYTLSGQGNNNYVTVVQFFYDYK